jgi:cytoskeletal protein RodZ
MNLHEQLGALEVGVAQLIQAAVAPQAETIPETSAQTVVQTEAAAKHASSESKEDATLEAASAGDATSSATVEKPAAQLQPTLEINRPAQNEITMTIGTQTVALRAEQIGQLIEELSNARASMTPEPPPGIPPGWRFVSTKNPVMAVQKQSNGDRLLVMRHTGHGWVPFTFSPDMVIQMYMMLTQG